MKIKLERIEEPRVRDYRISFKENPDFISKENQYDLLAGKRMRVVKTQNRITNSTPEKREKLRKVYGFLSSFSAILGVIFSLMSFDALVSGNYLNTIIYLVPVCAFFGLAVLFLNDYQFSRIDEDFNLDPFGEVRLEYNQVDTSKSFKNFRFKEQWEYLLKMGDYSDQINFRIDPEIVKIKKDLVEAENSTIDYDARVAGSKAIISMEEIEEKMHMLEEKKKKEISSVWTVESDNLLNSKDLK